MVERMLCVIQKREYSGSKGEVHQVAGEAVGCFLDRRARLLGMLNSFDDFAKDGVAAELIRPHFKRPG